MLEVDIQEAKQVYEQDMLSLGSQQSSLQAIKVMVQKNDTADIAAFKEYLETTIEHKT